MAIESHILIELCSVTIQQNLHIKFYFSFIKPMLIFMNSGEEIFTSHVYQIVKVSQVGKKSLIFSLKSGDYIMLQILGLIFNPVFPD